MTAGLFFAALLGAVVSSVVPFFLVALPQLVAIPLLARIPRPGGF